MFGNISNWFVIVCKDEINKYSVVELNIVFFGFVIWIDVWLFKMRLEGKYMRYLFLLL